MFMMNRSSIQRSRWYVVFLLIALFQFSGCVLFKDPYIGRNYNTSDWPKFSSGEKIKMQTEEMTIELTITRQEDGQTYVLEGTIDLSSGSAKCFYFLDLRGSRFSLILAEDNLVVDNIYFLPLGTDIKRPLPFKKTFKTVPFDSIELLYQISVK
jgi:hypothetical protein